jgi:hypothetical protein
VAASSGVTYTAAVPNPGVPVSRIELPLPILFAWMILTLILMGQGIRLASDRQEGFEPSRPAVLQVGRELEVDANTRQIVFPDPPGVRLAIYQELPERNLMRWVETTEADSGVLLIPLEGLEPGSYLVCGAPTGANASSQEMDRPAEALDVRTRFRILPR